MNASGSKGAEIISRFQHNANGIVALNYLPAGPHQFALQMIASCERDRTRFVTAVFTETANATFGLFGLVGVAVKDPGIVDSRIEPYVNRPPIGWNIIYGDRADLQLGRRINVGAVR
jgi:hypothetical protein